MYEPKHLNETIVDSDDMNPSNIAMYAWSSDLLRSTLLKVGKQRIVSSQNNTPHTQLHFRSTCYDVSCVECEGREVELRHHIDTTLLLISLS